MNTPTEIGKSQAQLLMSKLTDGELSPEEAVLLDSYLQENPDSLDWMEATDLVQEQLHPSAAPFQREESISSIQMAIDEESVKSRKKQGTLLQFPAFFRPLAAAAAVAVVGTVTWLGLRPSADIAFEPNIVEYVASDIPNSSTYIYSDEESGWTVVWVDSDSAEYDSQG